MIPVEYNVGSLWGRKAATLSTLLTYAIVVFMITYVLTARVAISHAFDEQGRTDVAVVVPRGPGLENTLFDAAAVAVVLNGPEVQHDASNVPVGYGDFSRFATLPRGDPGHTFAVRVRGVPGNAVSFYPQLRVTTGRLPKPATREAMAGKKVPGIAIGKHVDVRQGCEIEIVGVFECGGSKAENEIWTDLDILRSAYRSEAKATAVRAKLSSAGAFDALQQRVADDRICKEARLEALRETEFYEKQGRGLRMLIFTLGGIFSVLMSLTAMIGAMITMYASIASRHAEIGMLRALGFSRWTVVGSLMLESLLVPLVGGAAAAGAAWALGGLNYSLVVPHSFEEISLALQPTPLILFAALAAAAAMGVLGGFLPAIRAAFTPVIAAMRHE